MSSASHHSEFLAEAQEIVDTLGRGVLLCEAQLKTAEVAPDLINTLFRSAHSLKGLAGIFGLDQFGRLAHALEGLLDRLRLGKRALDVDALDAMFSAVEVFGALVAAPTHSDPSADVATDRLRALVAASSTESPTPPPKTQFGSLRRLLTEYEEHRLDAAYGGGKTLVVAHITLDLMTFDTPLGTLEVALKPLGELIARLPHSPTVMPEAICFRLIVALSSAYSAAQHAVEHAGAKLSLLADEMLGPLGVFAQERAGGGPEVVTAVATDRPTDLDATALVAPAEALKPSAPAPERESAAAAPPVDLTAGAPAAAQTVRVDIRRLDGLMNLIGTMGEFRGAIMQLLPGLGEGAAALRFRADLQRVTRSYELRLAELRLSIIEARLVPLSTLFERMLRAGRKMMRDLERPGQVRMEGEQTELDKLLVEELAEPLMHLMRNAVDHGLESSSARRQAGKSDEGTIFLSATTRGSQVQIEVRDDGAGIDVESIRALAVKRNLITAERAPLLTDEETFELLFLPGFSTREQVTDYSGRGVGLDVVKTHIARLSGTIEVTSRQQKGSTFRLILPITLAIMPALIVESGARAYALPLGHIQTIVSLKKVAPIFIEGKRALHWRRITMPLASLDSLLSGVPDGAADTPMSFVYAILVSIGERRVALGVDGIIGRQEIVIKALSRRLGRPFGLVGAAQLSDRRLVWVVDLATLALEATHDRDQPRSAIGASSAPQAPQAVAP